MKFLFAIIGAIAGAIAFHFGGFVAGGIIGWMLGQLHEQGARQKKIELELAWMRRRLTEHLRENAANGAYAEAADDATNQASGEMPVSSDNTLADDEKQSVVESVMPEPVLGFTFDPVQQESIRQQTQQQGGNSAGKAKGEPRSESTSFSDAIQRFFTGGNLLVKLGVLILFFGVSFLVKYAAQQGLFPVELRLAAVALGGLIMLATGWRLRERRSEYALALQGGGIGVLYLTTYAAFRLFELIPAVPALAVMIAISSLCGLLAIIQNSCTLALFGVSGGFVAPLLASIGGGDPRALFGYYALLNALIIGIAWFRSWRQLNLAGFVFTFFIGAIWGAQFYRPGYFNAVEPFLILYFLMYLTVSVLFAFRQPPNLRGYIDATLVFGTPVMSFALQAVVVHDCRYGLAWSALAAGVIYLAMAGLLFRQDYAMRQLAEAFTAFGVIFVTLALPLAFDGRWTSAAWAMEGAAMVWVGFRQGRMPVRLFGLLLQFAAGIAFLGELEQPTGKTPFLNSIYLGMVLLSASALVCARNVENNRHAAKAWEHITGRVLAASGLLWWFVGGLHEIGIHARHEHIYDARLLFIVLSAVACHFIERRLIWRELSYPPLILVPVMACYALLGDQHHPLANGGWLVWPLSFAAAWWMLHERDDELSFEVKAILHSLATWLLAALATWEIGWQVYFFINKGGSWFLISRAIAPALLLMFFALANGRPYWPLKKLEDIYLGVVALPLAVWSLIWIAAVSFSSRGDSWPFPWLPLLNQLDLAIAFHLAALVLWLLRLRAVERFERTIKENGLVLICLVSSITYLWLNSILARAMHYWGGVPFNVHSLFHSFLAQTSFTIFWGVTALCVMVAGFRRSMRMLWLAGAVLLGVVVVKLFLVDLASHGTVERIVSFVAVGILLLVIGWFAPVPPSKDNRNA